MSWWNEDTRWRSQSHFTGACLVFMWLNDKLTLVWTNNLDEMQSCVVAKAVWIVLEMYVCVMTYRSEIFFRFESIFHLSSNRVNDFDIFVEIQLILKWTMLFLKRNFASSQLNWRVFSMKSSSYLHIFFGEVIILFHANIFFLLNRK